MAAAVFIPPSPHDPLVRMATVTRRAPLQSIPNATNSPHRPLTTSGSKRPRTQASIGQQENEPPTKRQATEKAPVKQGPTTPLRQIASSTVEGRVFERGNGASGSNAFQKRLAAARDKGHGLRVTKNVEASEKETAVRQWQRHYKKIFPTFRFYFDNVQDDIRARFMRQIAHLGAVEEKFFSKSVTHIITTREIPPEITEDDGDVQEQPQTINPTLLDKNAAIASGRSHAIQKGSTNNLDILQRGRQMEMKIWNMDKLQRVLTTIFDGPDTGEQSVRAQNNAPRAPKEDLSQLLKHEKLAGNAEKEPLALLQDLHYFKGPFIYIHDMNEKYRPTMVREYQKVSRRTEGDWPQFRSASIGKCPFVEDPAMRKQVDQERRAALQLRQQQQEQALPRTRANAALEANKMEPPRRMSPRKALQEVANPPPAPATVNPSMLNRMSSTKPDSQFSFPPMPERPTFEFVRPSQLQMPREPAASGIQRSNVTSAIQSQMISSTAATGMKPSTSKEVHELKRKVLERTHTGSLSIGSIPSSHRMQDLAGALKNARSNAPQRAAKSRAQEKLGGIQEEMDPDADDIAVDRAAQQKPVQKTSKKQSQQAPAKDSKPGYCENCRDKYEDFEEHIVSRKHRKFAVTNSNWKELDALLAKLQNA